jgi:uncharacterized protein (TIGR02246 family)
VTNSTPIYSAIEAANEAFMDAFKRSDAAGLAALYTADGQVLPPNGEPVAGHEHLQVFWQTLMDAGIQEAELKIDEVEDHGDTAIELSKYVLRGGEGQQLDQGKYIVIWKQDGGQWKLHRDIFNSSLPAG